MVASLVLKVADNRSGQGMAEWGCLKVGVLAPRGRTWALEPPVGHTDFPLQSPPFGYGPLLVSGASAPCSALSRTRSVPSSAFNNEESLASSHPLLEASVSIFSPFSILISKLHQHLVLICSFSKLYITLMEVFTAGNIFHVQ